jgi:hypothetical protein
MAFTGAHIRLSHLLLVIEFMTVPTMKKPSTNQIAVSDKSKYCSRKNSALMRTINAMKARIKVMMRATTLIPGGYFPVYLPPMDNLPQGTPEARQS